MSERQRLSIPFGGGIDRKSGSPFVDQSSMGDLRNVSLYKGRMQLRKGLARALAIGWGDEVVGIFPIRKQGLTGVAVFEEASREVRLYAIDGLLNTTSLIGVLWTLAEDASTNVLGADVYDNLVLAHDEPDIGLRQTTRIYSLFDSSLSDMQVDLARNGGPADVKFRGVARHMNVLLGWGFGTEDDEDRPEVLRISVRGLADDVADWFIPEQYFLVGARGDPILGGEKLATSEEPIFMLGKQSEMYKLTGNDPSNFDVFPVDADFGYLNSRSHVSVKGEHFYWSLDGPRSTGGGPSADLEMPLDLGGPDPDPIVSAGEAENGCAYYSPGRGEVVFVFDDWAYVLHLKDDARRWSYREYACNPLTCVGLVYEGGGTILSLSEAIFEDASYVEPTYAGVDYEPKVTVDWSTSVAPAADDRVEVWLKADYGTDGWTKIGDALASAGTLTTAVARFWTNHSIALRVTRNGLAGAGYTGVQESWPAAAQGTVQTEGEIAAFTIGDWSRTSSTEQQHAVVYAGPGMGGVHPEIAFTTEQSDDAGGSWGAISGGSAASGAITHPNADSGSTFRYRTSVTGPEGSSAVVTTADGYIGPENIIGVIIDPPSFGGYPHDHDFEWGSGPAGGFVVAVGGHVHGTYEETSTTSDEPVENGITTLFNWSTHSLGAPQTSRVRYKVRVTSHGVDDYSEEAIHNQGFS